MKRQKPLSRMGWDFEDARTQRKTRTFLKKQLAKKERVQAKLEIGKVIEVTVD